jgi:hypothetical protein
MADILTDYTSSDTYGNYSVTDRISVFGDEDDLWGADEVTLAQLLDPAFVVKFDADLGQGTYRVDKLSIEVFYDVPVVEFGAPLLPPWQDEELQAGCVGRENGLKKFVVVGQGGLMRVSYDGETWAEQESGVGDTLRDAVFTEQGVCAVGDNGIIITSEDTLSWEIQPSDTVNTLVGVAYDYEGGNTIAVGTDGAIKSRGNLEATWETR